MTKLNDKISAALTPGRVVALLALCVLAWRVYQAPDDFDRRDPSEQVIPLGSLLASYVLDGNTNALRKHALEGDSADEALKRPLPSLSGVHLWQEIEQAKVPPPGHYLWHPVTSGIHANDRDEARIPVRLRAFERVGSAYVMTFVGLSGHTLQETVKREGVPMNASIFIRRLEDSEEYSPLRVLGRKVANAFWMHEHGSIGRWALVRFEYNFNRRDYFDWVRENGEDLYKRHQARDKRLLDEFSIASIHTAAQAKLENTYDWAFDHMRRQQEFVADTNP